MTAAALQFKKLKSPEIGLIQLIFNYKQGLVFLQKERPTLSIEEAREETQLLFEGGKKVIGCYLCREKTAESEDAQPKELIGYAVIKKRKKEVWLEWIYMDPEYRGTGAASDLFTHCGDLAIEMGADGLSVSVMPENAQMIRFLQKQGYKNPLL